MGPYFYFMLRWKNLFPVIVISSFLAIIPSCETDLEVNAPYKEVTVVYGLLNQNDSIHYIKINKSFLGEANAYSMAIVRDSSEYKNLDAKIEEWKSGAKTNEWVLDDTVITNKASGDFYYPEQTVYFFKASLDYAAQYKLNISIDGGAKIVTAETSLINNVMDFTGKGGFQIPCPAGEGGSCVGFYANSQYNPGIDFKWTTVKNGKRYQLKMTFNYKDFYTDNTFTAKSMDWVFQPPLVSSGLNGNEEMTVTVEGEAFYKELQKQLAPLNTSNLDKREFVDFYFTLYVASDDLNTYLLANQPSTGIIQEKPEFTNISNGIGIFSSRITFVSDPKKLNDESKRELIQGPYTQELKFCAMLNALGYVCN